MTLGTAPDAFDGIRMKGEDIIEFIRKGRIFSAAYYLKEMVMEERLQDKLFETALKKAIEEKDLWWQVRALQELEWDSELDELLKNNREEIEQSGNHSLLALLYKSLNDPKRYAEVMKKIYKGQLMKYERAEETSIKSS